MIRRSLLRPAMLALLLSLFGCGGESVEREQMLAFGTLVEITTYGVERERARAVIGAVGDDLRMLHSVWHPWKPGSLGRTNQLLATTGEFTAEPGIIELVERARPLYERSGGLFNPAIGRLVKLWGFHGDEAPTGPPPDADAIRERVASAPGLDDIELDGIRMRSTNPDVRLDFGAFAKGMAIDKAIERMRAMGVANAVINAGGDLRAIGRHGDRPWRIGIRDPRGEGVLASVEVADNESVFTSGDYERYFDYEGRRYHHILDPRTGRPARGTTSVTVIHGDAGTADAAATALFVAGPDAWVGVARALDIGYVMLVDANGVVHMNPAMAERIRFETDPRPEVVLSEAL